MAVSCLNHSLLSSHGPPRQRVSFSAKPTKTLEIRTLLAVKALRVIPALCLPTTPFSPPINTCNNKRISRCSFLAYLSSQDSSLPTTNTDHKDQKDDVKALENEAEQRHGASLQNLIKIYKEAILFGDEMTISEIEAKIDVIEKEKCELVQKVSALSADITSSKEKYLRLQADFDNFRKRSEKERSNIRSDAQGEVIESLLPMVDSFQRAKQQIKPETEKEKKIDTSYQGIYKQFVEIMRSLQVAVVATVGKPFDPSLHEAIAREDSQEYKEGIIIQEFRRGFLLGDRLLRPAMVKVSAGPGSKKASVIAEKRPEHSATAAGLDER
uniref:GrpE protein homolog n=1 Tax=Rhizophora mucronata TaxID=61149 RepID=A0A2P2IVA1_RHIMU